MLLKVVLLSLSAAVFVICQTFLPGQQLPDENQEAGQFGRPPGLRRCLICPQYVRACQCDRRFYRCYFVRQSCYQCQHYECIPLAIRFAAPLN